MHIQREREDRSAGPSFFSIKKGGDVTHQNDRHAEITLDSLEKMREIMAMDRPHTWVYKGRPVWYYYTSPWITTETEWLITTA